MAKDKRNQDDTEPAEAALPADAGEPTEEALAARPAEPGEPAEPAEPAVAAVAEPPPPRGKNTGLTIALCILNVAAAIGFVVLVIMDYNRRQSWSYSVFLHDVRFAGLPLRSEASTSSASRESMPRQRLDPAKLQKAFQANVGRTGDTFQGVEDSFKYEIRPQYLIGTVLKDVFGNLTPTVPTLEDEVERLQKALPKDIADAAQEYVGGLKGDRRQELQKLLLPLAYRTHQVDEVNKAILAAPKDQLDNLLNDAAQRRMLTEILTALDHYRPADLKDRLLEEVADFNKVKLEQLTESLNNRLAAALSDKLDRDSIEKRQLIAYLVTVVGHAKRPDGKTPLYASGAERAQVVAGLFEYALAVQHLTQAWLRSHERVVQTIHADREGAVFEAPLDPKNPKAPGKTATAGFLDVHRDEVLKLQELVNVVKATENRLADMKEQEKRRMLQYNERDKFLKYTMDQLVNARVETEKQRQALNKLFADLFAAREDLFSADRDNQRLEQAIRKAEGGRP